MPDDPMLALADRAAPRIEAAVLRAFRQVQADADVEAFARAVERKDVAAAVRAVTGTIEQRLTSG